MADKPKGIMDFVTSIVSSPGKVISEGWKAARTLGKKGELLGAAATGAGIMGVIGAVLGGLVGTVLFPGLGTALGVAGGGSAGIVAGGLGGIAYVKITNAIEASAKAAGKGAKWVAGTIGTELDRSHERKMAKIATHREVAKEGAKTQVKLAEMQMKVAKSGNSDVASAAINAGTHTWVPVQLQHNAQDAAKRKSVVEPTQPPVEVKPASPKSSH